MRTPYKLRRMSHVAAPDAGSPQLRRTLGPLSLWGLGVGYVISGEYFGWNLGLPLGGTYGMMAATLAISVLYLTFVFSYAELACAVPRAGGAFVYCTRGLGPFWGCLAGLVQIVEFVFAPPAIAMAIGAYLGQRFVGLDPRVVAIVAYLTFTALNAWGVRQAALFELFITVLAVAELLVFIGVVAPSFELANLHRDPLPNGWSGAFACLPFAIWFYLAIEGVANAAEEARNPQRDVPRGFGAAILTLLVLALGVFFFAVGVDGWRSVVYAPGSTEPSDAPLPLALAHVVSRTSPLYTLLLGVGLLGLVASFHGIILAAGRATMEFGRSGYAPRLLGRIHPRTHTPVAALVVNMLVGIVAILSGKTAAIITLSCFGAVSLYILAMAALFALRRKEPDLPRPFRAPAYPWFPSVALVLSVASLVALAVYNPGIGAVFAGLLLAGVIFYLARVRGRVDPTWAHR
jgi:ethanolamine permease